MLRCVIIGAGPAGMRAAEVLRQGSPDAEITLIGDEPHAPYQRPPLSKAYLVGAIDAADLALKPESFYAEARIRLRLGTKAIAVDRAEKRVHLADGDSIAYDKLLLATGCRARRLPAAIAAAPIHYLRGLDDAAAIKAALAPGAVLVVIGGGFIGLEIAASARRLGVAVTVLEAAPRLLARSLPPLVGDWVHALHQREGVGFELKAKLAAVERGRDGRLLVRTARAEYPCDLVVAGIGAAPNTELTEAAGLAVADGVRVDAGGRTSDPDIFAAGDVTRHVNPLLGRAIRIESWQVALDQAAVVARAMLGESVAYAELPWLWTDQYGSNIQVLGLVEEARALVVRGDPAAGGFSLLGLDDANRLVAAITVDSGRDMSVLRRLAALKAPLPKEALADPGRKLADLLKAARAG